MKKKKKIKALYQLIFLNVFLFLFLSQKKKKKSLWGEKIGNELEKKLHSRKVDPNRLNGPNELKKTVMDRGRPNRLCMTEMD